MIYTINTRSSILYPLIKSYFKLSETKIYNILNQEFEAMKKHLKNKGINYEDLKRALIPNQDKDNNEVCFVFDSTLIENSMYGYEIFNKIIQLQDQQSTYSILAGDYTDILNEIPNSQLILRETLLNSLTKCNNSFYQNSSQYYLVYINSITASQMDTIINGLQKYNWFYGYAIINYHSKFKSYLSHILMNICIKAKNTIILSHPTDYEDSENINILGYPFEQNLFNIISINEESFSTFLSYKIESLIPDKDDIGFSFKALFPKFDSLEKLSLNISDGKWGYLSNNTTGKGGILNSLSFDTISKCDFTKEIYKLICSNYIYKINKNEYNDYMFNVCIELPTKKNNLRKTTVSLKYHPNSGIIDIITIT